MLYNFVVIIFTFLGIYSEGQYSIWVEGCVGGNPFNMLLRTA